MKNYLAMVGLILTLLLFLSLSGFYFAIRPLKITSSLTPARLNIP